MYKHIDEERIFHFFEDEEMINEMLGLILTTNITELKNMDAIYASGNFEKLKKTCHKSKPTMLYLGANELRGELEFLEKSIPEKFESLYPAFLLKLEELDLEIREFLRKLKEN